MTQDYSARRDAGRNQYRLYFTKRIRCSPCIGCASRHVGDDGPGAFTQPALRQRRDIGTLRGGETAARVADEDGHGLIVLLNRNGMTQAIVVGDGCRHGFRSMGAGTED